MNLLYVRCICEIIFVTDSIFCFIRASFCMHRSISGLLGQDDTETSTKSSATAAASAVAARVVGTASTRLDASTSSDETVGGSAMKQSKSSKKLSELVSFNVMGYLRNSGWVMTDSEGLHQKYVDNMYAAELGDPNVVLSPESRANYNAHSHKHKLSSSDNIHDDNDNDNDSNKDRNNHHNVDNKSMIKEELMNANLVRTLSSSFGGAV